MTRQKLGVARPKSDKGENGIKKKGLFPKAES
jgi:hypothetical protein